jgi:hypothetical protein
MFFLRLLSLLINCFTEYCSVDLSYFAEQHFTFFACFDFSYCHFAGCHFDERKFFLLLVHFADWHFSYCHFDSHHFDD